MIALHLPDTSLEREKPETASAGPSRLALRLRALQAEQGVLVPKQEPSQQMSLEYDTTSEHSVSEGHLSTPSVLQCF